MANREKDQADFDLERFIDMFDEALTSNDERVVNALRSLMMMVILTSPESRTKSNSNGPLRRMFEDHRDIVRRINSMDETIRRLEDYTRASRTSHNQDPYNWRPHTPWDLTFRDAEVMKPFSQRINGGTLGGAIAGAVDSGTGITTISKQQIQPLTKGNENGK